MSPPPETSPAHHHKHPDNLYHKVFDIDRHTPPPSTSHATTPPHQSTPIQFTTCFAASCPGNRAPLVAAVSIPPIRRPRREPALPSCGCGFAPPWASPLSTFALFFAVFAL